MPVHLKSGTLSGLTGRKPSNSLIWLMKVFIFTNNFDWKFKSLGFFSHIFYCQDDTPKLFSIFDFGKVRWDKWNTRSAMAWRIQF